MSERKVLTKYYPPDFDPSKLTRSRGPKQKGPRQITVRLMAPFSMKCTSCGEFIYKGRKFNGRKETAEERYLNIPIYRFYIKCTRCSGEIVFRTDPRNTDYMCERGAKRNFEPWRKKDENEDVTDEQHLDMLEQMEMEFAGEKDEAADTMQELEARTKDAKREMEVADALDNIRTQNARREAKAKEGSEVSVKEVVDLERERQEREDEEAAKSAFQSATGERIKRYIPEDDEGTPDLTSNGATEDMSSFIFKKPAKVKKDFGAALGVKKGAGNAALTPIAPVAVAKQSAATTLAPPNKPSLLAGYDSDDD